VALAGLSEAEAAESERKQGGAAEWSEEVRCCWTASIQ